MVAFGARAVGVGADGAYVLSPWPYHAANFAAHAAGTVLLYMVLARLVRKDWAAWAAAALFAVHPLHVEPVSWATSLYTPLSAAFALAAAWAYLRFSDAFFGPPDAGASAVEPARRRSPGTWAWYAAVVVLYGLALLTKPTIILLPAILWVLEVVIRRRRRLFLVSALLAVLLFAGALPVAIATQHAQPATGVNSPPLLRPLISRPTRWPFTSRGRSLATEIDLAPDLSGPLAALADEQEQQGRRIRRPLRAARAASRSRPATRPRTATRRGAHSRETAGGDGG